MQPQQERHAPEPPKSPKSPSYKRNRSPKEKIRLPSPTRFTPKSKGGSKRRNKNKSSRRVK